MPEEMSASDGKRAQFYDIIFEDNLTFDDINLRYVLSTPNSPAKRLHFNMGTKKVDFLSQDSYKNLGPKNLKEYHCEKIMVKMRDDFEIPMVIKYDKRFYSESSPWVLFTKGIQSDKLDTSWQRNDMAFMSRGVVCAYPLIRGSQYFDHDWLHAGVAERKLTHIMDFIDSAIFLKEKGLTQKLGVMGRGESGSLTALVSLFQEPYLFESAVVVNPITDLVSHLLHDIENRQAASTTLTALEHDQRHYDKLMEFGDPQSKIFYEAHKLISPYHMPIADSRAMNTDLMICVDEEFPYIYHARKLICKLRQIFHKDNSWIFYKEYRTNSLRPDEKYANQ